MRWRDPGDRFDIRSLRTEGGRNPPADLRHDGSRRGEQKAGDGVGEDTEGHLKSEREQKPRLMGGVDAQRPAPSDHQPFEELSVR